MPGLDMLTHCRKSRSGGQLMMRIHWALMGSLAIVLAGALPLACSDNETVNPSTSASTSASSSSGGSGQGGSGGGAAQCMVTADCTMLQETFCGTPNCNAGHCELMAMHNGEVVP